MQLVDVCELIIDCEHKTAPTQETGYPSIRTPNIGRGRFILDGVNRVSEETYRLWTKRAVPMPGDLIMAREAPVGNVAMIPEGLRPCLGQRTLLIRPDRAKVDPSFLNYFLNGPHVQGLIHARTNGATVAHLNMKDVRTMDLPTLPPMKVQRRIAGILSTYDELIENCQRRIEILEEMARKLYREWFVHFRFPGYEKIARVNSRLGEIPKGWQVTRIGDAFKTVLGGTPAREKPEFWEGGTIPWINSGKVNDLRITAPSELITEVALERSAAKLMPKGTTVLAITGATLGQVSYLEIETTANQSVVGITDPSALYSEWIYLTVFNRINGIINHAGGGAQQHINKEVVNNVLVELPPTLLTKEFKRLVEPMFREVATLSFEIQNLRSMRDLLLPRLMSDQINVEEFPT